MKTHTKKFFLATFATTGLALLLSACSCSHEKTQVPASTKTIFSFLGAPGSGKGTLAERCVKDLGFVTVSTGNLCRSEIACGGEKGKMLQQYMMGGLVPDEVITNMVGAWLDEQTSPTPLILDGYPRTQAQASAFAELLKNKFPEYRLRIVYLEVSDYEEIVQRISNRLMCENKACQAVYNRSLLKDPTKLVCEKCGGKLIQRDDDKEEVVRKRLADFTKNNNDIIKFYQSIGMPVETLNVSHKSTEQIFEEFKKLAQA